MKHLSGTLPALALALSLAWASPAISAPPKKPVAVAKAKPAPAKPATPPVNYQSVAPSVLLQDSSSWIGKNVTFDGKFISFSPFALDYKGAMRSSKDYVSFLIERPDVTSHTIPLSELKLIFPRKKADSVVDLETGDKVQIKGKVFSAALGDPWVDVEEVKLLAKNPLNESKEKKKPKGKKDLD